MITPDKNYNTIVSVYMHNCYNYIYRQIDFEHVHSRLNKNLIAGHFGLVGLYQLCTRLVEISCNQLVIDSATHNLKVQRSNEPV